MLPQPLFLAASMTFSYTGIMYSSNMSGEINGLALSEIGSLR